MSETIKTKVLVVGGGPGGYVAAIRAGQLGLDTVLVEADRLGGTCLIRGCIPSKALIHVAAKFEDIARHASDDALGIKISDAPVLDMAATQRWKSGVVDKLNGGVKALLRKAKVRTLEGWGVFSDAKTCVVKTAKGDVTVQAEHVILANGSTPVALPHLPFGEKVMSSTEALCLDELPRHLVVVGAGYIGMELGMAFIRMGSKVTFIEAGPRVLPLYDAQLTKPVEQWLKKHGAVVHVNARAQQLSADSVLTVQNGSGPIEISCDRVLVTVGRAPCTQGWGLENMAVDMNSRFVKVDDQCRTSMHKVWAIGDLVGEPMLAHKASAQGEMVAEIIAGQRRSFTPNAIAAVCFTEPEIVGVGLSPDEATAGGIKIKTATFPFAANGRSLTMEAGADGGFVRVTARADNHLILGIHAVGTHASELSGEFALAIEMGARLEDIAGTIHVHPTMSEALQEATLATLGHAIHA